MKKVLIVFFISIIYMQGSFNGETRLFWGEYDGDIGFNLDRSYLSYTQYPAVVDTLDNILFKLTLDLNQPNANDMDVRLRQLYIDWTLNPISESILSLGLMESNLFKVQENTWGYRFIDAGALEKFGFINTDDLGIGYSQSF